MNKLHCASLLVSIGITACGGGGDSSTDTSSGLKPKPEPTTTITGVIADGYLSGALACLDTNDNFSCEENEPQSITNTNGMFSLTTTVENPHQYSIVAQTNSNTIDQDTNNNISNAYTLVSLPGQHAFVSPITTLMNQLATTSSQASINSIASSLKSKLGVSQEVNLLDDYIAKSSEHGELSADYDQLYRSAQLTARSFGINLTHLRSGDAERAATHNELIIATNNTVNNLTTITQLAQQQDSFDADAIALEYRLKWTEQLDVLLENNNINTLAEHMASHNKQNLLLSYSALPNDFEDDSYASLYKLTEVDSDGDKKRYAVEGNTADNWFSHHIGVVFTDNNEIDQENSKLNNVFTGGGGSDIYGFADGETGSGQDEIYDFDPLNDFIYLPDWMYHDNINDITFASLSLSYNVEQKRLFIGGTNNDGFVNSIDIYNISYEQANLIRDHHGNRLSRTPIPTNQGLYTDLWSYERYDTLTRIGGTDEALDYSDLPHITETGRICSNELLSDINCIDFSICRDYPDDNGPAVLWGVAWTTEGTQGHDNFWGRFSTSNDTFTGNGGSDSYELSINSGHDVITDFDIFNDTIAIIHYEFDVHSQLSIVLNDAGNVVFKTPTSSIELLGVSKVDAFYIIDSTNNFMVKSLDNDGINFQELLVFYPKN